MKHVELSDEQLKQVSGGYINANPQGELDWQRRQYYKRTHPGIRIQQIAWSRNSHSKLSATSLVHCLLVLILFLQQLLLY
jgi:bacteriocin-like protein